MSQSISYLQLDSIRQFDGLFSLNDLHRAAGGEDKHRPAFFLRNDQTKALIEEIQSVNSQSALCAVRGGNGGTYACRELVIAYAAWISAAFHLKVIRVFLGTAPQQKGMDVAQAMEAANLIAAQVQKRVFEQLLENDQWTFERWILSFDFEEGKSVPKCKKVENGSYVLPLSRFNEGINNAMRPDPAVLSKISKACTDRLEHMAAYSKKPDSAVTIR
ncbi:KilA-N domain-containing protein [Lampropedia aestuarii]|uniref:KilA-N domain-containing protein n=1 Tax=Lampropedia aestuarii TaxID=2562762 RepID=A0A4S5BTB2_9BURK|nr:KilA-N domain-containing protein [Lampropedia aestuarii]THJ33046.1 KilA-N domain-containing protein [Lampropedia aestuarii]